MKKQILFCLAFLCAAYTVVKAQTEGTKIYLPKTISQQQTAKFQNPGINVASCGPDTILYPYLKELTFTAPNDSFFIDAMVGNVRTASQAYIVSDTINVVGVQFWGAAYSTSTAPQTLQVVAYLYTVNGAYQPLTAIDSAFVTITEQYEFYEATFTAPVPVGTNFAVAVKSVPNDTLAVITNNAGNVWTTPSYGENLGWRRFGSGTWNQSVSFFGQDLEYMIFPIVTYEVETSFTASADSVCAGDTVMFTNTSSSIFGDRMLNLFAFDEFWGFAGADSTFRWSFAGGSWMPDTNSYAFTAPGTHMVMLQGEMLGYFSSCADTTMDSVYVPLVVVSTTFMNDTIWADATGAIYQWMECNGDTLISGATQQFYAPMVNGDYAVIITVDGCVDTADCVSFLTAGIKNNQQLNVSVYPNPAANKVTVRTGKEIAQKIEVINILGESVITVSPSSTKTEIDLSTLHPAVYFVKVKQGSTYKVIKVFKE